MNAKMSDGQRESAARRMAALGMTSVAECLRNSAVTGEQAVALLMDVARKTEYCQASGALVNDEACWALCLAGVKGFEGCRAPVEG